MCYFTVCLPGVTKSAELNGICYWLVEEHRTHIEADANCAEYGGHLAIIHNADIQAEVTGLSGG